MGTLPRPGWRRLVRARAVLRPLHPHARPSSVHRPLARAKGVLACSRSAWLAARKARLACSLLAPPAAPNLRRGAARAPSDLPHHPHAQSLALLSIGPADLRWWYDALHAAAPAPTPQAALAAAALPTEPAAGEPTDGAIKPFANALGSQRAENHVDLGGADTPRIKPQAQSSEVPALAAAGDAAKAAEKGGSAGAEEAMVGNSTFSDLVCQLFDMASAGSHAHACSEASSVPKSRELMSALTFASLHRSKLAPAILQLLLSPQAPQSKG